MSDKGASWRWSTGYDQEERWSGEVAFVDGQGRPWEETSNAQAPADPNARTDSSTTRRQRKRQRKQAETSDGGKAGKGAKNPEDRQRKHSEWVCPSCQGTNFMSNACCRKCSTPYDKQYKVILG